VGRQVQPKGRRGVILGWRGNPGKRLTEEELKKVKEAVRRSLRDSGVKVGS